MPGVESVTSELSPEDSLSSGILLNCSRSTSVCIEESLASMSPPASTITVESAAAIWRASLRLTPTAERISTLCLSAAKLGALTPSR